MRYFFIERPVVGGPPSSITGSDAKHIKTVLRLKPGDKIGLFDGKGLEYRARIEALTSLSVQVAVLDSFPSAAESELDITVAQAFLKERKMDGLVRQLTELGITKWIPFFARRSVSKPDEKQLTARTIRWQKIAKEALKQCRRARIPDICSPVSFEEMLTLAEGCHLKIAFWEEESTPLAVLPPPSDRQIKTIFAVLGPEGGFTAQEIQGARACGFVCASLGPRILKAETATVAACALLQYLYGDMGKNLDKNPGV